MRNCGLATQTIRKTGFVQRLFPCEILSSFVHVRGVMIPANLREIKPSFLIPTMKPLDSDKKVSKEVSAPAEATQTAPVVEEKIDFSNVQIEPLFEDQVDFDTFSKSDFRAVKVKECEAVKKSKKLLKFVLDDGTGADHVSLSGIHAY